MRAPTDQPAATTVPFDAGRTTSPYRVNGTSTRRTTQVITGDARSISLDDASVDLVVTSPPYWQKRDYGVRDQIGQESTPQDYVDSIMECLTEWGRLLRPTGSVFLNVGDSFHKRSLVGIPGRLEAAAIDDGWIVRNRIIWAKAGGMPEAVKNRLASRHEYVIHLVRQDDYYYNLLDYANDVGNGTNPGDVWQFKLERNMGEHLAPFPSEIARRAILLACPEAICVDCATPRRPIVERTTELNMDRPQARRAVELAEAAGLTDEHIRAIQATGVSDAGKALRTQTGTGRNRVVRASCLSRAARVSASLRTRRPSSVGSVTVWSRWLSAASRRVMPSARLVPHSEVRATLRRVPSRRRADQ